MIRSFQLVFYMLIDFHLAKGSVDFAGDVVQVHACLRHIDLND